MEMTSAWIVYMEMHGEAELPFAPQGLSEFARVKTYRKMWATVVKTGRQKRIQKMRHDVSKETL